MLGVCALFFATTHAPSLSATSVFLVVRKARCQSLLRRSDKVYARSDKLTFTRGFIKWFPRLVIAPRREKVSLADNTKMDGRTASSSSMANSSSSVRYEETWCRSVPFVASMIAWALEPPKPKEFMEARRGASDGQGIPVREVKTLLPVKSTVALK